MYTHKFGFHDSCAKLDNTNSQHSRCQTFNSHNINSHTINSHNINSQYQLSQYQLSQHQLTISTLTIFCAFSLPVSYTGTKSYNSTFRNTGSQSVSGEEVVLTNFTSDTNYSIVVTSTNTAGFRKSSDTVVGTTLTGRKLPLPTFASSLPIYHTYNITFPSSNLFILLPSSFPSSLTSTAPPSINEPPRTGTQVGGSLTFTLTIARASNLGGQIRSEQITINNYSF